MPRARSLRIAPLALVLALLPGRAFSQAPAAEPPVPVPPPTSVTPSPEPPPAAAPETSVDLESALRGDGQGLTAEDAVRRALGTAPSIERARAAVLQAGAGADRALYALIPQLTVSARYTRLSEIQNGSIDFGGPSIPAEAIPAIVAPIQDPAARVLWQQLLTAQADTSGFQFPVLLDSFAFRASLSLPLSDIFLSILPSYEAAQSNARAAELSLASQRDDVSLSARQAFYNYARARGALAVARIAVDQAESRHQQVQAFVAAGTAAPVDELRIRAQLAAANVAVLRTEGGVAVSATALRTLMHAEPNEAIAVGEDLLSGLPELPAALPQLIAQADAQRNDALAVRRIITAASQRVDAAEGSRYPHLVLQGNLDVANPNQRVFPQTPEFRESWDVSAVLQWSPHDVLNGEAAANEARALRGQAEADLRAIEDGIRLQVTQAATNYEAARQGLEAARLGVTAAEESYRVSMERYRAGASTVSDVIDASAEQLRAQLDLVNTAIDARLAWAQLQRALGEGTPAAER